MSAVSEVRAVATRRRGGLVHRSIAADMAAFGYDGVTLCGRRFEGWTSTGQFGRRECEDCAAYARRWER